MKSIRIRATEEIYADKVFSINIIDKEGSIIIWGDALRGGSSSTASNLKM